jgi:molecular chaperone DnaJ
MPRNYYMVLGVERGADLSQIKRAYRSAIKRYHPDRFGTDTDPDKFMAAQEAYEVLSDIDRRRAYDAELRREGIPVHLTRIQRTAARQRREWRKLRETASPLDDFFEGLVPGFYSRHPRRASMSKDLYMEVVLTPEEARRGGVFPVAVPVLQACPDCRKGGGWVFFCPTCGGRGAVQERREFSLAIPPEVADGTSAAVPLADIGLTDARLHIDVRVRALP